MNMKRNLLTLISAAGLLSVMVAVPVSAGMKKPVSIEPATSKPAPTLTSTKTETKTIVDIASTSDTFKTLTTALKAAGLDITLAGQGPFTVFAPTDKAFAALPAGTVEKLLKPENKEKLVKLLTYHVVPGSILSTDLKSGDVKTVEGSPVSVSLKLRAVMVNNAKVTKADIKASNGVIHAVDRVILPPDMAGTVKPASKKPAMAAPNTTMPMPMQSPMPEAAPMSK